VTQPAPRYGQAPQLSYSEYLHVPQLLREQVPLADPPAHDELQFIIVHQVYELWFRLVLFELDEVRRLLDAGDDAALRRATHLCRRVVDILKVCVAQIHVLESMRPVDFLAFRGRLNPASGFQSCSSASSSSCWASRTRRSWRASAPTRAAARCASASRATAWATRSTGCSPTAAWLSSRPTRRAPRRSARPRCRRCARCGSSPTAARAARPVRALLDIDEQIILWRRHHVMMVERQIGAKPGTGKAPRASWTASAT